jgi:hypothetical protein
MGGVSTRRIARAHKMAGQRTYMHKMSARDAMQQTGPDTHFRHVTPILHDDYGKLYFMHASYPAHLCSSTYMPFMGFEYSVVFPFYFRLTGFFMGRFFLNNKFLLTFCLKNS